MTKVGVKPRSSDQGRRKNDAFALLATLPTKFFEAKDSSPSRFLFMIIMPCCEYSKNNYPGPEIRGSLKIDNLNGLIIDLKGAFKSNFSLLTKMSGKPKCILPKFKLSELARAIDFEALMK